MRILHFLIFFSILIISCKNESDKNTDETAITQPEQLRKDYPSSLSQVFEAHGGIENWNKWKTLKFKIDQDEGSEMTTIDLKKRYSLIETEKFKLGFDGTDAWIDQDSTYFKNDPIFYHNLMFYFYAMPFVLGDDGIIYSEAEPLTFKGVSYPGIRISYKDGVGASSKDEYILYYDQESHKMQWLGYTVTYFSKEKGKDLHYIKYDQWQNVNNVLLPKALQWYNFENDSVPTMRNEVQFKDVELMEKEMQKDRFVKPSK